MVKQIKQFNIQNKIGAISLQIDELIEILERRNFKRITAKTHDHEFESLDDIKQHKALVAGFPDFSADGMTVSFYRLGPYIRLHYRDTPESDMEVKRQALYNDILSKKTILDYLIDAAFWVMIISSGVAVGSALVPGKSSTGFTYFDQALIAGWLLSVFLIAYGLVRHTVRLKPKTAIGSRAGELIIGIVVSVVGGLILRTFFGI